MAVLEASDEAVDQAKTAIKLGIGLIVLILVMANRRKPRMANAFYYAVFVLTIANVCVAVFWSSAHA